MKKILFTILVMVMGVTSTSSLAKDFEDAWGYVRCVEGRDIAFSHLYLISIKGKNETYSSQREKDSKKAQRITGYTDCSVYTTYNKWSYEKYKNYLEAEVKKAKDYRKGDNSKVERFQFSE